MGELEQEFHNGLLCAFLLGESLFATIDRRRVRGRQRIVGRFQSIGIDGRRRCLRRREVETFENSRVDVRGSRQNHLRRHPAEILQRSDRNFRICSHGNILLSGLRC